MCQGLSVYYTSIINIMKRIYILLLLLLYCNLLLAGDTLRALFIGNSYTDVNNLPEVVAQFAAAGGDQLIYQKSVPGGYTFEQHTTNSTTLALIAQGGWDYVVLQEQSQRPSFSDDQVTEEVYPYARRLDSLVHLYSPCAKTVFYMTWGRKNGDASNCAVWPPVCTYEGMDSLLQLRYTVMAEDNEAVLSPVARIWRHLRSTQPAIELYQADESHPTAAGTFAAAASFYSLFFGKTPLGSSYNFTLSPANAATIKTAAAAIVFDSLDYWRRFYPYPRIDYPRIDSIGYDENGSGFTFYGAAPQNVLGYEWNFGDGTPPSFQVSPAHTFSGPGPYQVCLTLSGVCDTVVYCTQVGPGTVGISSRSLAAGSRMVPNPTQGIVRFRGDKPYELQLYDMTGRLLLRQHKPAELNISRFTKGTYLVRLYDKLGNCYVAQRITLR